MFLGVPILRQTRLGWFSPETMVGITLTRPIDQGGRHHGGLALYGLELSFSQPTPRQTSDAAP